MHEYDWLMKCFISALFKHMKSQDTADHIVRRMKKILDETLWTYL